MGLSLCRDIRHTCEVKNLLTTARAISPVAVGEKRKVAKILRMFRVFVYDQRHLLRRGGTGPMKSQPQQRGVDVRELSV